MAHRVQKLIIISYTSSLLGSHPHHHPHPHPRPHLIPHPQTDSEPHWFPLALKVEPLELGPNPTKNSVSEIVRGGVFK